MNTNEKYILYHWLLSQEPEKPVLSFNTSGGPGVIEVYPRDLMSLIDETNQPKHVEYIRDGNPHHKPGGIS